MRELTKSSRAELDIFQIWAQLSVYGYGIADRAIDLIERRCEVVRQFPFGGEACPEYGLGMRKFPAGNYVIFYIPLDDCIQVARVLDGRRDQDRAFWQDY